jgi:hypothetical protein
MIYFLYPCNLKNRKLRALSPWGGQMYLFILFSIQTFIIRVYSEFVIFSTYCIDFLE